MKVPGFPETLTRHQGHDLCIRWGMTTLLHTPSATPDAAADEAQLPRRTLWVLAVGSGLAVANLYYAQPLLAGLAVEFGVTPGRMGLAATLSQVGYGLGLLFFVPLGDAVERRGLILAMLLATTAALLAVALSPGFAWFAVAVGCENR